MTQKLVAVEAVQPRKRGKYDNKTYQMMDGELTFDVVDETEGEKVAFDFAEAIRSQNKRVARAGAAALTNEVSKAINGLRRKNGLDNDKAQEAIADTLEDLLNRIKNGHPVQGALVQTAATAVASRFVNEGVRHETAKALRILKQRMSEVESKQGHSMSNRAIKELAEQIRFGDDFNERHRPTVGFERFLVGNTSLDQHTDSYRDEVLERYKESDSEDANSELYGADAILSTIRFKEDKPKEVARDKENKEAIRQAQLNIFPAVAEKFDAPAPTADRLTPVQAKQVAGMLTSSEAVLDACSDAAMNIRSQAVQALFAPFAGTTHTQREDLVEMFRSRSKYAHELWLSAVHLSTAQPVAKTTKKLVNA